MICINNVRIIENGIIKRWVSLLLGRGIWRDLCCFLFGFWNFLKYKEKFWCYNYYVFEIMSEFYIDVGRVVVVSVF